MGSYRSANDLPVAALTEREREIVALVADGLTNQAIADRLGLARLAVSQHVATRACTQNDQMGGPEFAPRSAWDTEES